MGLQNKAGIKQLRLDELLMPRRRYRLMLNHTNNEVEGIMSERDMAWQEQRLEEILFSNVDAVSKVQEIIRLGFDPEVADELVERHQLGTQAPVYYESLTFADEYDDPRPPKDSADLF